MLNCSQKTTGQNQVYLVTVWDAAQDRSEVLSVGWGGGIKSVEQYFFDVKCFKLKFAI